MKRLASWQTTILLIILALSVQGCLDIDTGPFKKQTVGNTNQQIGINTSEKAAFQGKIYFTLNRNLYVLDGQKNLTQLTRGIDVRDPAVSPDGKKIAFIRRDKNYSDLMLMDANGSNMRVLRSGKGAFVRNPYSEFPQATFLWYAQPDWSEDGKRMLFLSDLAKRYVNPGVDSFMLDLQVFAISLDNPGVARPQEVAYATYGDGGLRDPSYRPHHPDQIVYTSYKYDNTNTRQVIQIMLEDPDAIARHPGRYRPGVSQIEVDPAVALTPDTPDLANMQPAFSPDGNTILYVRREDATHMSLYTMPVAEGVTGDPNNPNFNPNTPANQQKGLAPYNQSVRLLTKQYISGPVWSPDGTQIAYLAYNNNTFDLWLTTVVKDPKTGAYHLKPDTEQQLTSTEGQQLQVDGDSRPVWTK